MRYIITESLDTPAKINKYIEAADFMFTVLYMGTVFIFTGFVHPDLKILYYIFSLAMCIFLTSKSTFNKKRRNYESIFLMIMQDLEVYSPVYDFDEEDEDETEDKF